MNLLLAFCRVHPRFPHPLLDQGYVDDIIVEREFLNQDRDQVSFDLIVNSQMKGSVLLLEVKGGLTAEAHERCTNQYQRYLRITADDVSTGSGVSLPDNAHLDFDVCYVCPLDTATDLLTHLGPDCKATVFAATVQALGDLCLFEAFETCHGALKDVACEASLNIRCDPALPIPDHYFPFDANTHLLTIANEIWPIIQTLYLQRDRNSFTELEVVERAMPVWPFLSQRYRLSIATVVRRVLKAIADAPNEPSYSWDNGERAWAFDEAAEERIRRGPPLLSKPAWQYLGDEWDVDQIDAFFG